MTLIASKREILIRIRGISLVLLVTLAPACHRSGEILSQSVAPPAPSTTPVYPANTLLSPEKERDLFDALDFSGEELNPVRDALARGDYAAAQHLLADYFRQRTSVPWKFDPHHPDKSIPFNKQIADDAVIGRVTGGLVPVWAAFPNGKIDWLYNETFHRPGLPHNNEWQWQLCRMAFWDDMGKAYQATGDERYARAWVGQLRSFVSQCPPPTTNESIFDVTGWRTIEAGIRMSGAWPNAYERFLLSPSVSDEDLLLYIYGSLQHARFLEKFNSAGNWLTMEMCGLYMTGAVFPEFKQAAQWRDYASGRMFALEKDQFLPDGAHEELSTGYHNVAIDNITALMDIAALMGRAKELPAGFIAPMEKAYDYEMYLAAPDGQIPQFNDSWHSHVKGCLMHALQFFPGREDYLWFTSDGKQGHSPAETSHAFDWAGFYVMRSSWDRDANYLVLRAGPLGASHAHQDKLSLIMWPYGREVLFNSGGGTYDQSKWRTYSVETFSHNTVLVDYYSYYLEMLQ